ncbi:hypothetical protein IJ541_07295 [bacterium]|nr:hypothetical protein [bacterium]
MNETNIETRLKEKLKEIWDNSDFIRGVSDTLKTDANRIRMEKLLDQGLRDTDKILLLSLSFQRGLI